MRVTLPKGESSWGETVGNGTILSTAVMVIVGAFGAIGWISILITGFTGYAQGRRARLIGVQFCACALVTTGLWTIQSGVPDLVFYLYLHAAIVSAIDLLLVRWFRWRLWAGVRMERKA